MTEFDHSDDLVGARFDGTDLRGARFRNVDMRGMKVVDALLEEADISGLIDGLRVNGVEVAPLIEQELDRLHPERRKLRPVDPPGFAETWALLGAMWEDTIADARALPPAQHAVRVDEEWSFVETLRHLIFVTDAWIGRVVLGLDDPFHPWGLPPSFLGDGADLGLDLGASPSLDEVLAVRRQRVAAVDGLVHELTPVELNRVCGPNQAGGYPPETDHQVIRCLWTVFGEEWAHHRYAERDLAVLEA